MRQFEQNGDRELILRAKDGDMDAFETLVKKYQKSVYALCRRMSGDHQSADDLSQETFIKAYISLQKFKDGLILVKLLFVIAMQNQLMHIRVLRCKI